ncbi:MAG: ABC transporter permease [Frankiales bacterium]|nr:ABC transporter permease [Frankiales bacterium]
MTTKLGLPTPGEVAGTVALQRRTVRLTGWRLAVALAGLVAVISAVRIITGAQELDSAGTIAAAIGFAIPLGMAGLGGLWSERSGVVNIGLEGMMILGTWGAGWAGTLYGPWWGLLAGVVLGAIGGLVHAIATVTFAVDQIVSGVAINLLGLGVTQYLSTLVFPNQPTQSDQIPPISTFTIPGLSDWSASLADHQWFFVSDLGSMVHAVTTDVPYTTLIAVALLPITFYVLWRTAFGLRLRSCGEAPYAAESLGVNVYFHKYVAVVVSGGLAGFGGAVLATVLSGIYREGQTQGQGFIGLAAMIFGNWRVGGLASGSLLFGYTQAMQLRSGDAVHALLLVIVIGLVLFALFRAYRRAVTPAVGALVVAVVVFLWYRATDQLPDQVAYVTPYVATLLVLSLASQRLRMPAADGRPYIKGQEH